MGKKRKTNMVPISQTDVRRRMKAIMESSCKIFQDSGWLLFLAAVREEDENSTPEKIEQVFESILDMASTQEKAHELTKDLTKYKEEIGFYLPHSHMALANVKTHHDLQVAARKIERNSLYSAIGIMCAGLRRIEGYTPRRVRNVFMIADTMDAEIVEGRSTFDDVLNSLKEFGVHLAEEISA